jgi:hypothetical protein
MLETIPNLWSAAELKPKVVTPAAILRAQASQLSRMTQGVLEAEVTVLHSNDNQVVLGLEIIAKSLHGYRHRLLSVRHDQEEVYPATVFSGVFQETKTVKEPNPLIQQFGGTLRDTVGSRGTNNPLFDPIEREVTTKLEKKIAYSEEKFVAILKEVLQAPATIAMLQSLIARSNEVTNPTDSVEEADAVEPQTSEQSSEGED